MSLSETLAKISQRAIRPAVRARWPEIDRAIRDGYSIAAIHAALKVDGFNVGSYKGFLRVVRAEQCDRAGGRPTAGSQEGVAVKAAASTVDPATWDYQAIKRRAREERQAQLRNRGIEKDG